MAGDDKATTGRAQAAGKPGSGLTTEPGPAKAAEPFAYVAAEALFIHDPESGVAPARAYNPGDLVPPADVKRHGWQESVRHPEE
jgi:hypothetical protein